jgi:hypothetical protein
VDCRLGSKRCWGTNRYDHANLAIVEIDRQRRKPI